jgi:hypothetical protein
MTKTTGRSQLRRREAGGEGVEANRSAAVVRSTVRFAPTPASACIGVQRNYIVRR